MLWMSPFRRLSIHSGPEGAWSLTPLCPAGHLPLKGEIDLRQGFALLDA